MRKKQKALISYMSLKFEERTLKCRTNLPNHYKTVFGEIERFHKKNVKITLLLTNSLISLYANVLFVVIEENSSYEILFFSSAFYHF